MAEVERDKNGRDSPYISPLSLPFFAPITQANLQKIRTAWSHLTADWQRKFLSTKFSSWSQLCSSVPQHYTYWNEIRRNMMKKARHFLKQDPSGRNEICYPSFAGSLGINTKWKNIRKHKNFHNFDTLKRWFNRNVPLFSVWIVGVSWCVGTLVFWRSDFGIWKVWQWCYNVLSKVIHGVWSIACFYGLF